jgi:hypothetical protein
VFIVAEASEESITSYDYGQFFGGKHGGRRVTRRLHVGADERLYVFTTTLPGRPLIGRLDPFELLEGAFLRGELEAAEVPDEFEGGRAVPGPSGETRRVLLSTREIQAALVELGYDPGPIDGIWGRKTRSAVRAFQRDAGLVADGVVGGRTRGAMRARLAMNRTGS